MTYRKCEKRFFFLGPGIQQFMKERWHVRTKENIARVRRDEAEAAEKEKQERLRTESADREARLNILKFKSKQRLLDSGVSEPIELEPVNSRSEHINLFSDLEHATTSNKDHDLEEKEKKEEYEKKIGLLTYLGQDTNEALKKKNWYEVLPESSRFLRGSDIKDTYDKLVLKDQDGKQKSKEYEFKDGEIGWRAKQHIDPINAFKKYCHGKEQVINELSKTGESLSRDTRTKPKSKKKKQKKDKEKEEKEIKLQKLRLVRLKREQQEKYKTEIFLTGINNPIEKQQEQHINKVKRKYNSQFNPELARQNYK